MRLHNPFIFSNIRSTIFIVLFAHQNETFKLPVLLLIVFDCEEIFIIHIFLELSALPKYYLYICIFV